MDLSLPEEVIKHTAKPAKAVLWENVEAIMKAKWKEGENFTRLGKLMGYKSGTMAKRLASESEDMGMKVLDKLARGLGYEPWQLLAPNLNPDDPPLTCTKREKERAEWANNLPKPPPSD